MSNNSLNPAEDLQKESVNANSLIGELGPKAPFRGMGVSYYGNKSPWPRLPKV